MRTFSESEFRATMSQFCTGVVVVAGCHLGQPAGFSAQSFISLSLDPALVAICPSKNSSSWPKVRASGSFCINILGADQRITSDAFARPGCDKFSDQSWFSGVTGSPILERALGFIDCRLESEHDAGDHTIAVGRVMDLQILDGTRAPLLYFRGGYCTRIEAGASP